MGVGVSAGSITDELGAPSFVHSFFSTISAHCEPTGWGSRFPHLMNGLYQGRLPHVNALLALGELQQAKVTLSRLPPGSVVWDIVNRQSKPPGATTSQRKSRALPTTSCRAPDATCSTSLRKPWRPLPRNSRMPFFSDVSLREI